MLALADLYGMEGRNEEAIALLERYLKNWADDALHTKLAQVFAVTDKLGDSLSHYQTALRYKEISANFPPSSFVLNTCNFNESSYVLSPIPFLQLPHEITILKQA